MGKRLLGPLQWVGPALGSVVARPRLDDHIARGVDTAKVTLVSAGAGSGKTTAVANWLRSRGFPGKRIWLDIAERHNERTVLHHDIFTALAPNGFDLSLVKRTHTLAAGVGRIMRRDSPFATPTLLILDDLQEIAVPQLFEELRGLIEHRPPALRLLLIGRSDPPLRLQRWRLDGSLAEIRAKELAFQRPEAAELFHQHGIELTPDQMNVLLGRTQGWAAGLRLAAMSLDPEAIDASIAGFAGDQHSVAEYLVGEVLNHLPARTHRMLVRLSVVEEISTPLAVELTGDRSAPALLRHLADENDLLFGFSGDRTVFRFHPLLRELLFHQLMADDPEQAREQHRKAAQWLQATGEPVSAVRQAILSREEGLLHTIVLTAALPAVYTEDAPALTRALRDTPPGFERLADDALRDILRHILEGDYATATAEIAQRRRDTAWPPADEPEADALALLDLITIAAGPDSIATTLAAEETLQRLRNTPAAMAHITSLYRTIVLGHLGVALLWSGHPARAERYLLEAARESNAHGLELLRALCLSHLALLEVRVGHTRLAERYAVAALNLGEATIQAGAAHLALAQTELLCGNIEAAGRHLEELRLAGTGLPLLAGGIVEADVLQAQGALAQSAGALEEVRAEAGLTGVQASLFETWYADVAANVALLEGSYQAVLQAPGDPDPAAQIRYARAEMGLHRPGDAIKRLRPNLLVPEPVPGVEAWVVYAAAMHDSHDEPAAAWAIHRALQAAEPQGLVQPFTISRDICLQLMHAHGFDSGSEFREHLASMLGDGHHVGAGAPGLIEPLTERELNVLRYLPTLRRNTEIGESMFVTVNTVKAHLKSVYRKLGVKSRREAVERARELNLL